MISSSVTLLECLHKIIDSILQSYSKREFNIYISNFRKIKDAIYQSVPKSTFDKRVGTNSIQKFEQLENIL